MPPKVDEKVKEYLLEKDLASLLEQFIVSCVESRPDDVLQFMEKWARERRGGSSQEEAQPAQQEQQEPDMAGSVNPGGQDPRDVDVVVREAWASISDKTTVGQNFFKVLFLQHPSLKRTLFKGFNADDLAPLLATYFGNLVDGNLSDDAIKAIGDEYAKKQGLEAYHFQYFITAMLMGVQMALGTNYASCSTHWQKFCTAASDRLMGLVPTANEDDEEENQNTDGTPRDEAPQASGDAISIQDSWMSIEDKNEVGRQFMKVLLLQHANLKRTLLKDLDTDALGDFVVELFGKIVAGTLTDDEIKALGDEHAEKRGLENYHTQYFITAMLMALQIVLKENYAAVAEPWRKFLADESWRVSRLVPAANANQN